jgi:hypothetical protein
MNRLLPIFDKLHNKEFYRFYFWQNDNERKTKHEDHDSNPISCVSENFFDLAENKVSCSTISFPNNKILFIDLDQNIWENKSAYNNELTSALKLLYSNIKEQFEEKKREKNAYYLGTDEFSNLFNNNMEDNQIYSPWFYSWVFKKCAQFLQFGNVICFHSKAEEKDFQPYFDFSYHYKGVLAECPNINYGFESFRDDRNITFKNIVRLEVPSRPNFEGFEVINFLKKVRFGRISSPISNNDIQKVTTNFIQNKIFDYKNINLTDINVVFSRNTSVISSMIYNNFLITYDNDCNKDIKSFFKYICTLTHIYDLYKNSSKLSAIKKDLNEDNSKIIEFLDSMDKSVFESLSIIKIPSNSLLLYYLMNINYKKERKSMDREIDELEKDNLPDDYLEEQKKYREAEEYYHKYEKNDGLDDMNSADPDWIWNID